MRVKRGTTSARQRRRLLSRVKGFRWGRSRKVRLAKTALLKAGSHAYRGRKEKKRTNRQQWHIRINAVVRTYGLSYSRFIAALKTHHITVDRKILADLAEHEPKAFKAIVDSIKPKK